MKPNDFSELEKKLAHKFRDRRFIFEALCHRSFVNEQFDPDLRDNERLEFLGDAVLNLVIGHMLMQYYPDLEEGSLSRLRSNLVNESQLAGVSRTLDVGSYIQFGKGEIRSNGWEKNSILADTFEAIIAAVYLDGGFDAVFNIIERHFSSLLCNITDSDANNDYKSQLQEFVQGTHRITPHYTVIQESGPDHDKTFRVQLNVLKVLTEGAGKSKKRAEQDAARKALDLLKSDAKS
ncbi:MAG: ribonuclease III [Desulfobacterales bacterium]